MRFLAVLVVNLLLIVSATGYAQTESIDLIRLQTDDKNTATLYFSVPETIRYQVFSLKNPQRLVMDFASTSLRQSLSAVANEQTFMLNLRTSRRNNDDLRIVLDLKNSVEIESFSTHFKSEEHKVLIVSLSVKHKKIQNKPPTSSNGNQVEQVEFQNRGSIKENNSSLDIFSDWDISGYIGVEDLAFIHNGLGAQQRNNYLSGVIKTEFYKEWDNGKQNFVFVPFYRYSQFDNRRTHFDIRELNWMLIENAWELRVGFRKVFWGVTEGLHLIDIINQTDLVENTDTEDKLGQPMINLALINDWGTVDLFLLTGFRERTFSGPKGRFSLVPEVAVHDAVFDKNGLQRQLAYAIRWSHYIGDWDIGVSHFYGMGREPRFIAAFDNQGKLKILPLYETINQTSLDVQMTRDSWLWKLEAMLRSGMGKTFFAATGGVEYTLFDLQETGLDLGVVIEYMYDTRGANNFYAPFQDDILTALRFGFNDEQSTEILAGILFDRSSNSKIYNIEASRRIGDSWKIEAEMRLYAGAPPKDSLYILRQDDNFRIELSYHF